MSLSYLFRVLALSAFAYASDWEPEAATAAVFSEPKKAMPKGATQAVELLRFVTAYKKGVEALVDVTPYSALLRASADTDGELTFYAFIDTWVGNNTPHDKTIMRLDGAGQCTPTTKQEEAFGDGGRSGNGWQLDADLVFYPKVGAVDTRPRESITLSSGYYGGYSIGGITAHEGIVAVGGDSIEIAGGVDLTGTLDAEVYPCPGGAKDVERGIKMGQVAKKVQEGQESSVVEEVYKQLEGDSTKTLTAVSSDAEKRHVEVSFDDAEMHLEPGMPVWYEGEDIDAQRGTSKNESMSGDSVGKVVAAEAGKATIEITGSCFPSESSNFLPRLKMEKSPGALAIARKAADSMKSVKQRMKKPSKEDEASSDVDDHLSLLTKDRHTQHRKSSSEDDSIFKPFLVGQMKDNAYGLLPILGQVDLGFLAKEGAECAPAMLSFLQTAEKEEPIGPGSPEATAARLLGKASGSTEVAGGTRLMQMTAGDKVCILARRATGRVFQRSFDMPTFVGAVAVGAAAVGSVANSGAASHPAAVTSTDRVLLQFAVTGHGWSGSTEQCGEFCHAIYHIKVNGVSAANVTEWRADCEKNPVSGQFGTWEIHRDGWCPGSVEPGLYIDMTKWAKAGKNELSVDLSVWSSKTKRYERYTNYGNYLGGGDGASLFVGATMFVYDGSAVDAILGQGQAYTAAEAAIRDGSSFPKALQPPERVNSAFESSFLERSETDSVGSALERVLAQNKLIRKKVWRSTPKVEKHTHFRKLEAQSATQERFNFEARAPWYNYDEKKDGVPGARAGATVVHAFTDGLIQLNTREIRVKVNKKDLPRDWGHAAVHFRLESPGGKGLEMDNWDRVGSLGLIFEENAATTKDTKNSKVKLRPSSGRKKSSSIQLTRVASLIPTQA